jgi:hypothetical protein
MLDITLLRSWYCIGFDVGYHTDRFTGGPAAGKRSAEMGFVLEQFTI